MAGNAGKPAFLVKLFFIILRHINFFRRHGVNRMDEILMPGRVAFGTRGVNRFVKISLKIRPVRVVADEALVFHHGEMLVFPVRKILLRMAGEARQFLIRIKQGFGFRTVRGVAIRAIAAGAGMRALFSYFCFYVKMAFKAQFFLFFLQQASDRGRVGAVARHA